MLSDLWDLSVFHCFADRSGFHGPCFVQISIYIAVRNGVTTSENRPLKDGLLAHGFAIFVLSEKQLNAALK